MVTVSGTYAGGGYSMSAPVFDANKDWYYYRFTCTEGGTYTGSAYPDSGRVFNLTPAAGQYAVKTIGFSGLVTFSNDAFKNAENDASIFNYTAINGNAITTGILKSHEAKILVGGSEVDPTTSNATGVEFTKKGAYLNLDGTHSGSFATPGFAIDKDGNAKVKSSIESSTFAAGNTFTGGGEIRLGASSGPYIKMRVDSNNGQPQMIIHDGSRERVKLGFLGSY